jgi:hypothetical protein
MRILGVICTAIVFSIVPTRANALLCPSQGGNSKFSIQIVVELQKGGRWERVDAQTVFHAGDEIRFRFRASQGGYLYVLNRTSDKTITWLFPRVGAGERSQVEQRVEYLIPTGQGAFEVGGSPGFDVTYWILSPIPIDATPSIVSAQANQTSTLQPRCRTEVLKARGLCTDERAGPHSIDNPVELPLRPPESEKLLSRDLKFRRQEGATQISGLTQQSGVVVYEFTIAHH